MNRPRIAPELAIAIAEADTSTLNAEIKTLQVEEGKLARKLNQTRRNIEAMKIEVRSREGAKAA